MSIYGPLKGTLQFSCIFGTTIPQDIVSVNAIDNQSQEPTERFFLRSVSFLRKKWIVTDECGMRIRETDWSLSRCLVICTNLAHGGSAAPQCRCEVKVASRSTAYHAVWRLPMMIYFPFVYDSMGTVFCCNSVIFICHVRRCGSPVEISAAGRSTDRAGRRDRNAPCYHSCLSKERH